MRYLILVLVLVTATIKSYSQGGSLKKPLDFSVYDDWKVIEREAISDDGKWVLYEVNPYKGDGELVIMNPYKLTKKVFKRGTRGVFSPSSKYMVYKIVPQTDSIRALKLKKVKKDKFPQDSLGIWVFKSNKMLYATKLKTYKIPIETSEWMAYMHEFDRKDEEKKKNGKKPKGAPKVYDLVILNPINNKEYRFRDVLEFDFSRNGKLLGFIQVQGDSVVRSKVSIFNTEKEDITKIFEKEGFAKKISMDNNGTQGAFIYSPEKDKSKVYRLYYWSEGKPNSSEIVIDTNSLEMPKDWVVSEYGNIWFSRNDSKMFFGTALKPEPAKKDTLLEEEKIKLDLWSWKDPLLQTQQLVELRRELTRNYLTVYHPDSKQVARLSSELIPEVKTTLNGNGRFALGITDKDFQTERSWEYPWKYDYYIVDVKTGDKRIALKKSIAETGISSFGKYIFWYDREKKAWFTKNTETFKVVNLTSALKVNFYDEEFDRPSPPPSYDYAGWTENDEYFLVYDKYDIWKLDPTGQQAPICITNGYGRQNQITFRYLKLDRDIPYIESNKKLLLDAFNQSNKQSGYYTLSLVKAQSLEKLIMDDFNFYPPQKAKNADQIIWRKSSIKEFPNLWYSNLSLKNPLKISQANPQQEKYIWPTVELVKWKTFDQKEEEGLLYKPENFDPTKKYPMIVRIYETYSNRLHTHFFPIPSRSSLDITYFVSNGYLVFLPNIRYEAGNPGKSAFNYVVSGTKSLIARGYIDENEVGIQGHSWGGYQTAYIITQTNLFKAACAGAPVSNMTSAYGNIYWKYGYSRMTMYEADQSRIGASLWEKPELYIKNSPIFYADKIETPLLIMHNDGDGAVPWNQGIQLFVALRRYNKPVWLLNYNKEPHSLRSKSPNSKDLSKRMFQFFNHYLKGEPMPVWLKEGIPAVKKGKTLGYELEK